MSGGSEEIDWEADVRRMIEQATGSERRFIRETIDHFTKDGATDWPAVWESATDFFMEIDGGEFL